MQPITPTSSFTSTSSHHLHQHNQHHQHQHYKQQWHHSTSPRHHHHHHHQQQQQQQQQQPQQQDELLLWHDSSDSWPLFLYVPSTIAAPPIPLAVLHGTHIVKICKHLDHNTFSMAKSQFSLSFATAIIEVCRRPNSESQEQKSVNAVEIADSELSTYVCFHLAMCPGWTTELPFLFRIHQLLGVLCVFLQGQLVEL